MKEIREKVGTLSGSTRPLPNSLKSIKSKLLPYFYIMPGFVVFSLFVFYPLITTLRYSLTKWDGFGTPRFVGLANYITAFLHDPIFRVVLRNNFAYIVFFSAIPIGIGLLLASLIARANIKGIVFFRTVLFTPQIVPLIATGIIWCWILSPILGVVNELLSLLGLGKLTRAWLGDPSTALFSVGGIGSWVWYGFCMVIFLAGIQKIDESFYDAAKIDGANAFHQFLNVTVPGLRYELTVAIIITVTQALRVFALVYVTTRGGPGRVTLPISLYTYNNVFQFHKVGYGASLAVILTAFILILSWVTLRLREEF